VRQLHLVLMVSGATLFGCGGGDRPALVEVNGTVTLDGKPLEGAVVVFQPVQVDDPKFKRPARSVSDAAGKINPNAYGDAKGLPPGKYKVGVSKREFVDKLPENFNSENPAATPVRFKYLVPKGYEVPESSGLEVEITGKGMNPETLALETGGGKPVIESTAPRRNANDP
jgi:hypothetical protein